MAAPVSKVVAAVAAATLAGLLTVVLVSSPARKAAADPAQIFQVSTTRLATVPTTVPTPTSTAVGTTVATPPPSAPAASTPVTAPRAVVPPPSSAPRTYGTYPTYSTQPPTTPLSTTTTIAPLGNSLPVAPVTLPLRTRGSNAHVSPVFAILSGVGFFIALLMILGRLYVTRPGGLDRRPVAADTGRPPGGDGLA